jgi:hypothetical protein
MAGGSSEIFCCLPSGPTHLEVLLLFLFAFQTDGDLLGPGILRKRLLVLCHCLLDLRKTLLQFLVLCPDWKIECHSNQENERDQQYAS